MKNLILKYNEINESNEFNNFSFEEIERLVEIGILNADLLKIYNYVKNGSVGDLELVGSTLTHLPNWLVEVEGDLILTNSNIEEIPDSLILHGGIIAENSKLKVFNRKYVNGHLDLDNCKITKLPDHLIINGYLSVREIQFEEIPKNLRIRRNLFIRRSNLEQFSDEELYKMYTIGGGIAK